MFICVHLWLIPFCVYLCASVCIDLGDPQFGRLYQVHCDNAQVAADVLPATTRSRLVEHQLTGVHITGDQLIAWQKEASNKPAVLAERLSVLADLVAAIPASAWQNR